MDALLLLKDGFDLYHVFVPQLPEDIHSVQQSRPVGGVEMVDLPHQHSGVLVGAFLALPKGVVVLHYDDHLLRHLYYIQFMGNHFANKS